MNKSKYSLFIILIMILSISAVSAAEITDTSDDVITLITDDSTVGEVNTVDDIAVQATSDNDVITDPGDNSKNFTTLQNEISSGFVQLGSDYVRAEDESEIEITSSVIIIGNDQYKIDANNLGGIFKVTADATLTLNNVVLVNGNANEGGAIYNEGKLNVISSQISNSNASTGGAIYNTGITSISGSTLDGNTATNYGGSVYSEGTLIVDSSNFENNKINAASAYNPETYCNGGAAIFTNAGSSLTITGSTFTGNTAPRDKFGYFTAGGAIYVYGAEVSIATSKFNDNVAGLGGALTFENYNENGVTITDSTFNNNNAWQGGAVNVNNGVGDLTITGSEFIGNTATQPGLGGQSASNPVAPMGGAISVGTMSSDSAKIDISESIFESNSATNGGAISISASNAATISGSEFTDNTADVGSAIMVNGNGIEIDDSTFTDNNGGLGTVFFNTGTDNTLSNSVFEDNTATYGYDIVTAGKLSLTGNDINKESAGIVSYAGGVITSELTVTILNNDTITLASDDVVINATVTDDEGNIIYDQSNNIKFIINNEEIPANYVGALKLYHASYTLPGPGIYTITATNAGNPLNIKTGAIKNTKGSYTDLQEKINNADETLELEYNFTFAPEIDAELEEGVEINDDLEINGNGYTINGNNLAPIFSIDAEVALNNINFINGVSAYGGAIFNWGELTITECTFENNTATFQGGAIFNDANYLVIEDSVFKNNKVTEDKAYAPLEETYGGAAIFTTGYTEIHNSNFTQNTAPRDKFGYFTAGGAIYAYGVDSIISIENSLFEENIASLGGAIVFEECAKVNIADSQFKDNNAWQGGAVNVNNAVGSVTITSSNFTGNTATTPNLGGASPSAGAISIGTMSSEDIEVSISECKFTENSAEFDAGAISVAKNSILNIKDSEFTDNEAKYSGAIAVSGIATIDNVNFTGNKATGIVYVFGQADIYNSNFTDNDATNGYDVISAGELTLENNDINKESAGISSSGEILSKVNIIVLNNQTVVTTDYNVKLNATVTDDNGNIILDNTNIYFVINDEEILAIYNTASNIYEVSYTLPDLGIYPVTVKNDKFTDLTIKTGAFNNIKGTYTDLQNRIDNAENGVLDLPYNFTYSDKVDGANFPNGVLIATPITINGNGYTISGNNSHRIFNVTADATIKNTTFVNGSASEFGGAIYASADLTVTDSVFDNNNIVSQATSGEFGGSAIFADKGTTLTVKASNFTNNNKDYADGEQSYGAVAVANIAIVEDSYFSNNKGRWGGAITAVGYLDSDNDAVLTIKNTVFENNKADYAGAVFAQDSGLIIDGSKFNANEAYTDGGAIVHDAFGNSDHNAVITNSVFDSNKAARYGSAIDAISSFTYYGSNFTNNKAPTGTAAIHYMGTLGDGAYDDSSITNCIFKDNNAAYYGAIYFYGLKSLDIIDSQFISNTANIRSGAVFFAGNDLTIESTNFTENKANGSPAYAGAVYYDTNTDNGALTIDDSKFTGNTAKWSGAIFVNTGAASISNSEFVDNVGSTYINSIMSATKLALENNTINTEKAEIFTYSANGIITSQVNITVLENKTVDLKDNVLITAKVTDDNGNLIKDTKFQLVVNETPISTSFNATSGLYQGTFTPSTVGVYIASMTYTTTENLNIKTGTLRNIKGTYTDLQNQIDAAEGTLVLPYDFIYTPEIDGENFPNGVLINKEITIDGNGSTISGNNSYRIFNVTAKATIKNTTFVNGSASEYGGAIYASADLTVTDSVFDNNNIVSQATTGEFGGSAIFADKGTTLTVKASNFTNNNKDYANGEQSYGAVAVASDAIVEDSYFSNNKGRWGGAITAVGYLDDDKKGSLTIKNTTFENNKADQGGAVFAQASNLIVEGSKFNKNEARDGGAIDHDAYKTEDFNVAITDSSFDSNKATRYGSAIVALSGFTYSGTNFTNNKAPTGTATIHYGPSDDSIFTDSSITNCIFENNTADYYGGIYFGGDKELTIADSKFINNTGNRYVGAVYLAKGSLNIDNTEFTDNTGGWVGDVLTQGTTEISNSKFSGNTGVYAGAIMSSNKLALENNTINTQKADIYIYGTNGKITSEVIVTVLNNETVTFNGKQLITAKVTDDNGNLIRDAKFKFIIDETEIDTVYNATSKLYQGTCTNDVAGIYIANITYATTENLTVKTATLRNIKGTYTDLQEQINNASDELVLPYDFKYTPEIDGNGFVNGVKITQDISINGNGSTISGNNTKGIFDISNAVVTIENVTLTNGSDFFGGAMYIGSNADVTVVNVNFTNNKARGSGAAIYTLSKVTIKDSNFIDNVAGMNAGAIHIAGGEGSSISNSNFIGNNATGTDSTGRGGAIYANKGITVKDSTFENNFANTDAGAIFFYSGSSNSVIENSKFIANKANKQAGAIWIADTLTISGSNFTDNEGNNVIYIPAYTGAKPVIIKDSIINGASENVIINRNVLTLERNNITGNVLNSQVNANISLSKNNIDGIINNTGNILTEVNAVILNNETISADLGSVVTLNATLTDDNNNNIYDSRFKFTVNDEVINATYDNENALYTAQYTIVNAGEIVVTTSYNANILIGIINVEKANVTLNITVEDINVGEKATVNINLTGVNNTGLNATFTVVVNNTEYIVTTVDGIASFEVENLTAGNYDAFAVYEGDSNYNHNYASDLFTVNKLQDKITITVTPAGGDYGTTIEITAVAESGLEVKITVNGENYTAPITPGAGVYTVVATTKGNDTYEAASNTTNFTISKAENTLTIANVTAPAIGEDLTVNITLGKVNGTVHVVVDGEKYTATLTNGNGSYTIEGLTAGDHSVVVIYPGDDNNTFAYETYKFSVDKLDSPITITVNDTYKVTDTISIVISDPNAVVTVNGEAFDKDKTSYAAGTYTVTATVEENATNKANSTTKTFTVEKKDSLIKPVTVETVTVGQKSTINIELNSTESGSVIIEIDGVNYTANINSGIATLEIAVDANTTAKAYYLGGDEFNAATPVEFEIKVNDKADSIIVIDDATLTIGQSAIITATVNGAAADIVYIINGADGATIANVEAGTYTVTATFAGNTTNKANSTTRTFTVVKLDSPITITAAESYNVNDTVNIAVIAPAGAVITVNGEAFDADKTSYAAGTYTIVVTVEENATNKANSSSKTFTVSKLASEVTIGDIAEHVYGEEFTIAITNNTAAVVTINGVDYTIVDGNVTVSGLPAGTYTITANIAEDDTYTASTDSKQFTIAKATPEITADAKAITSGDDASVEIEVENATGVVVIDGKYYAELEDGKATITVPGLTENTTVEVKYLGNDNLTENTKSIDITVSKTDANMDLSASEYVDDTGVYVELPEDATGTVTAYINGEEVGSADVEDGFAYITIPDLAVDNYTVEVKYSGDDKYNATSGTVDLNVTKYEPYMDVTAEDVTVGENTTIFIDLAYGIDDINVTVDGTPVDAVIDEETATVTISKEMLVAGEHAVVVSFNGNDRYTNASVNTTFNVSPANVTAEVSVPENATADEAVITVTLPENATGNVTVTVGNETFNATVENGTTKVPVSGLKAGENPITVSYTGDDNYNPTTLDTTVTVAPKDADTNVTVPEEVKVGDNPAAEVTLPEDATGNVTVVVDGKEVATVPVENGTANIPLDNLTAGDHTVEVKYSGDDKYAPASETKEISVSKITPTVNATAGETTEGETATITVEVPSDATGVVLVEIDGNKYYGDIENGKATVNAPGLKANDYTANVSYPGDEKYANATTTVDIKVKAAEPTPEPADSNMSTTVPGNAAADETPVVNVTLPKDATGNVSVLVDGKEVANVPVTNGTASVPLDNLTPGAHLIETKYSGDDKYAPASSADAILVSEPVTPEPVNPNMNTTVPGEANTGDKVSVDANLPADATGNVSVLVDGKEVASVPVTNGTASIPLDNLTPGAHLIETKYSGDDKYVPVSVNNAIVINEPVTAKIDTILLANQTLTRVSNDFYKTGETGGDYYVELFDTNGNPLANKTIQVAINGVQYNITTESDGKAHQQINMESGNVYTYAFAFQGDDDYNAAPLNSTRLTVTKKTTSITAKAKTFKASAKTKSITVTLKTSKNPYDGKTYLSSGKKLTLKVNGKTYKGKTNAKNQVTFKIKLTKKGKYTAKIKFAGTKIYAASSKSIKVTIK